jgi:NADH:ubiquinone oxidoreductase subunit F (NADH-binding)
MGAPVGNAREAAGHRTSREDEEGKPVSAPTVTARLPRLLAGVAGSGGLGLDDHLAIHGPMSAPAGGRRARSRSKALIDEVESAGLRGRGGAGFPTALKLHAVAGARGRSRTVVVNAAEGEPASHKDRALMLGAPHLVLDGAEAAAAAVGARDLIVCVSEAAPDVAEATSRAIAERPHGHRGARVRLAMVPDSYVSGQESALVSHLNGGPAKPTFTPPMIFERGVGGHPTLLSNAETFAHIALIARHGAAWFRGLGTPEHPGSALVTLRGPVDHPGVYEIEHGSSLESLIDAAGGSHEGVRAILIGGYAGTWIDARELSAMTLDDGWLAAHGASTGAGVIALLGESSCAVAETVRVVRWLAAETAGQCGPCVHGLAAIAARLEEWVWGGAGESGVAEISRLAAVVRGRGACRHPDGTLRFIASAMDVFAEELADHARHGACAGCHARQTLPLPGPPSTAPGELAGASL